MKSKRLVKLLATIGLALVIVILFTVGCARPAPPPSVPASAPAPPPEKVEVTEWIFQPSIGPEYPAYFDACELFVKMVDRETEGTVKVKLLPSGSITSSFECIDATSKGLIDVTASYATMYVGEIPECVLPYGLPACCENHEEAFELMWDYGLIDIVQPAYERHNLFFLSNYCEGLNMYFTNFKVEKWEDFEGKSLRAGGPQAEVLAAFGGIPVGLDFGDIYKAGKLGLIDGYGMDLASIGPSKLYEVSKYLIFPAWNAAQHGDLVINLDSWNALDDWQREAIGSHDFITEFYFRSATALDLRQKESLITALQYGCEIIKLSPEEEKRYHERIWNATWGKFAELSPDVAAGIEICKQFLKDKGRWME